jgi:hypothetical protein
MALSSVAEGFRIASPASRRFEGSPGFVALAQTVYMTGGNKHEWPSQGVPNSILIEKPFAPAQIVTAVSQVLNTSGHWGPFVN